MRWRPLGGTPRERHYVRVSRVAPEADISPFTSDLDTLRRGVTERVFLVKAGNGFAQPPRPSRGVFGSQLQATAKQLDKKLRNLRAAPISHQAFVDRYSGRKKVLYQKALEDIRDGTTDIERDASVKCFVKYEKTDFSKKDQVPRVISPRDPKYNIRLGRYLASLEKRIFHKIDQLYGHPTVLKGYDAVESARILCEKWNMYRDPVAVGLDASRFDQHVSSDALKWEHKRYLACFPGKKHKERLARLLKLQLVNKVHGMTPDGEVEYTIHGTRMSGDMNTSLGNCLLMCSMVHAFSLKVGVNVQLANNGDDCVVFMERTDYERFMHPLPEWFLSMGFNMTVEPPSYSLEEIEFCQTRPVFDGEGWIMCRDPRTAIVKDSIMLDRWVNEDVFKGWLDAVGTGGLALTARLPVFQEFYKCYQRSGKWREKAQPLSWSMRHMIGNRKREVGAVHPAARSSFYYAFDITPDEQVVLEDYYSGLSIVSEPGTLAPRRVFN